METIETEIEECRFYGEIIVCTSSETEYSTNFMQHHLIQQAAGI
jgi:hypothetical protein